MGQVPGNGACEEENEDDGGGDPERAVQVRVSVQDIEERRAWVERRFAAAEDFGRVDVKELRVEGERPQKSLGRGGGPGGEGVAACVRRDFGAGIRGVCKVWEMIVKS